MTLVKPDLSVLAEPTTVIVTRCTSIANSLGEATKMVKKQLVRALHVYMQLKN